jgi:hypothetical protein
VRAEHKRRQFFPAEEGGKKFHPLIARNPEFLFYKPSMRISSFSPLSAPPVPIAPARVNSASVPDTFAPQQTPATTSNSAAAAGTASTARGPISVDMLMSIASSDGDREQRKRVVANAEQGLDHLEALHTGTLSGQVDPETLKGLSSWLSEQPEQVAPEVASIMRDINLRAKVELAKHEAASGTPNG